MVSNISFLPSFLNEAPSERICTDGTARTALEGMTDVRSRITMLHDLGVSFVHSLTCILKREAIERVGKIEKLQRRLHKLNKDVEDYVDKRREEANAAHNKATKIITPQFYAGDFVVVYKVKRPPQKLIFLWSGPQKGHGEESNRLCRGIFSDSKGRINTCSSLEKYGGLLDTTLVLADVRDLSDYTAAIYEVVENVLDIAKNAEGL